MGLSNIRNNDIHRYNTRQRYKLHGTCPTCKSVVHSFSTRSFQIWNAMSNVIDLNVSLFAFKCETKTFLFIIFERDFNYNIL